MGSVIAARCAAHRKLSTEPSLWSDDPLKAEGSGHAEEGRTREVCRPSDILLQIVQKCAGWPLKWADHGARRPRLEALLALGRDEEVYSLIGQLHQEVQS